MGFDFLLFFSQFNYTTNLYISFGILKRLTEMMEVLDYGVKRM